MAQINLNFQDRLANKTVPASVPDTTTVASLIPMVVKRLEAPADTYALLHVESKQQLLDKQTLADAKVKDGDHLRLVGSTVGG